MATAKNPNYVPTRAPQVPPGSDLARVVQWVDREMRAIAASQTDMPVLELRTIDAPPPNPREGMIVFADGTNWNPGAGKGTYVFKGGAWVHIV